MLAPALLLVSAVAFQPADEIEPPSPTYADLVVIRARRILPSVGLMNDHLHKRGEFMIGVRYQHFDWGGANRHGTHKLSNEDLMDAGYMMRATSMTMDMAMADLMYGISDDLTVTVSPQYVWNRMKMIGTDPMDPMSDKMSSHGLATRWRRRRYGWRRATDSAPMRRSASGSRRERRD